MIHSNILLDSATSFKQVFPLIFLCALSNLWAQNQFSKNQVLEDMEYLMTSLEESHYNLYAYTPKSEFDKNYNAVRSSITKDSLSLLEATSVLQRVISAANNGHTEINFPAQSYGDYLYEGGTLFPLELAFEYNRALVRKNWSGFDQIKPGDEVLSINDMPIQEVLTNIYPQVSAERPYFKNTKIELFSFPRYYWQVFGKQDEFKVAVRSGDTTETYYLRAVPGLEGYEMKRTETVNSEPKRELKFFGQAAYLNPGSFSGDEPEYQKFIDSAFVALKKDEAQTLIVDLRNNLGGDDRYSDYLISYFADKPFTWTSRFTLKTSSFLKAHVRQNNDTTSVYWQEVLNHKDGEIYQYDFDPYRPQPVRKRFTGEVYVLVNRQSHSQAAVTAAQIQDNGFGIIAGEETGDYPSLYASVFRYPLPNTGISVQVSKGYIERVNGSTAAEGVIPDIFIKDHLLDEKDEILEGLLMEINSGR